MIREFNRLRQLAIQDEAVALDVPTSAMISLFTFYQRPLQRVGVGVGGQCLQDIIDFDHDHRISPETPGNDFCSLRLVVDCDSEEPSFFIILSTKKLLADFDLTRPIETDETFKVMHENYPLTLIGQSDANRKFHVRYH